MPRQTQKLRLLDGALGTELERRGHDLRDSLWSAHLLIDEPGAIAAVHRDYVLAGADILITSSYQLSFAGTPAHSLDDATVREALTRSVTLAREAARGRNITVAASIGPYGAARADGSEFTGIYDRNEDELVAFHRERFRHLAASDADMLAVETLPSFAEAKALLRLLDQSPRAAWFSFACRNASQIADGTAFADCVALVASHTRVAAVGINCTPPQFVAELVTTASRITNKPVLAYPNSGETWDATTRGWSGTAMPGSFVAAARRWRERGASWIGGCCRTTPEHIRALRTAFASELRR